MNHTIGTIFIEIHSKALTDILTSLTLIILFHFISF